MCDRCFADLRRIPLRVLEGWRDEPTTCAGARRAIDQEITWRRGGMDPDADEPV